ncbi:hypothetical protein [Microlunatus sp. GCM10028923]|uniref:hypothetical protein n=1 Tax=Microlunatus sp. GCM10028923 TaxID=3273400 RepID=UPI0036193E6D
MRFHLYERTSEDTDTPSGTDLGSYASLDEAKETTPPRRWIARRGANGRRVWLGLPTAGAQWYDQVRERPDAR